MRRFRIGVLLGALVFGSLAVNFAQLSGASTTSTTLLPTFKKSAGPYEAVAGAWHGHGRGATIEASGAGVAIWRTYRSCSQHPQPCDRTGLPISYFRITFTLRKISRERVTGVITSSDALTVPRGPLVLKRLASERWKFTTPETLSPPHVGYFCGAQAKTDSCGA